MCAHTLPFQKSLQNGNPPSKVINNNNSFLVLLLFLLGGGTRKGYLHLTPCGKCTIKCPILNDPKR